MSNLDHSQKKQNCTNQRECLEMLQLILDGEASMEQKEHFKNHLEDCMPCFQHYQLDMSIRELLKLKCSHQAPSELVDSIKSKINQNSVG